MFQKIKIERMINMKNYDKIYTISLAILLIEVIVYLALQL